MYSVLIYIILITQHALIWLFCVVSRKVIFISFCSIIKDSEFQNKHLVIFHLFPQREGHSQECMCTRKSACALARVHVPPTKVFRRLAVNKTILKPCVAAVAGAQYLYLGFSPHNKIPLCSAYNIGESNPVPVSGL